MIIYCVFLLVVICLLLLKKMYKNDFIDYLIVIVVLLFASMRFNVGFDYMSYYNMVDKFDQYIKHLVKEPLHNFIVYISYYFNSPQLLFIIYAILMYSFIYLTIKDFSHMTELSLFLYITFPMFFLNSLDILRQHLAVAIVFYSIRFVFQKNFIKYLIMIIFASLFHRSAIIAIPIYFFGTFNISKLMLYCIIVVSNFLSPILFQIVKIIMPYYVYYLENKLGVGGTKIIYIVNILAIFIIWIKDRLVKYNKNNIIYINLFVFGTLLYNSLLKFGHAGPRASLYFIIFLILILPDIIYCFKERTIIKVSIYFLCVILFFSTLFISSRNHHKSPYIPYNLFFIMDRL